MGTNVIALRNYDEPSSPAEDMNDLIRSINKWAEKQGIDMTTAHYKYQCAAIITLLQVMPK